MGHIPFGYRIVDGKAVVDEKEAVMLWKMYEGYLEGKALRAAAEDAGIHCYHGSAARILGNKKYLGTDYYPQIIAPQIFGMVQAERDKRAKKLGRMALIKEKEQAVLPRHFRMKQQTQRFTDPIEQALYLYSLIESED